MDKINKTITKFNCNDIKIRVKIQLFPDSKLHERGERVHVLFPKSDFVSHLVYINETCEQSPLEPFLSGGGDVKTVRAKEVTLFLKILRLKSRNNK